MPYYSFRYSLWVIERFLAYRPRGWRSIQKVTDNFEVADVALMFQSSQFKWNVFKKLVKHLDRVDRPDYLTNVKVKELWRYFSGIEPRGSARVGVDTDPDVRHSSRAPKSG